MSRQKYTESFVPRIHRVSAPAGWVGAETVRKSFMFEMTLLENGSAALRGDWRTWPGRRKVVERSDGALARVALDDLLDLEDDRLAVLPFFLG